jgi:hypothetical protein
MKYSVFNTAPERATFPVLGLEGQPDVRAEKAPITVGDSNPALRELEGVGVVAGAYEPIEPTFDEFKEPVSGRYKLRFNAYSVWVGPAKGASGTSRTLMLFHEGIAMNRSRLRPKRRRGSCASWAIST